MLMNVMQSGLQAVASGQSLGSAEEVESLKQGLKRKAWSILKVSSLCT